MYWLSPFHYILEAMLGVVIHGDPVRCEDWEFARFRPPPGETCQRYAAAYISKAGGYVQNGTDGLCNFCRYQNGDQFGQGFSVYYSNRWRNVGIFCAFIGFNFAVVYISTWLRFKGKNPLKTMLGKRNAKQ
jgi:ABC-type multidrug transport system permease subunit